MKNSSQFNYVALLCIALPCALVAKTPSPSSNKSSSHASASQDKSTNIATKAMATYDLDHDGVLDKAEIVSFKAADAALATAALTYDADHDGVLNPTELDAWVAAHGKSSDVASKSGASSSKSKTTSK